MTTQVDIETTPKKPRPRWRTILWLVLAAAGAVWCAVSVIAKFTFADNMSWLTVLWAAVGTLGFSGMAIGLWRQAREH